VRKVWGIILLLVILGVAFPLVQYQLKKQEAFTPDNLIRIHVIANSNSEFDQDIKLKVRDRLVNWLSPQLAESGSAEESRAILAEHLDVIGDEASREVKANQGDYGARVSLGRYEFPTRRYGDVVLPAGEYQALKVILGKGEGVNWWCVLYPPLCVGKSTATSAGVNPKWLVTRVSPAAKKKPVSRLPES